MTMLPQVLLSGLIFPLSSIAAGVRWIAYLLPLTYFNEISRGVMLRAEPIGAAVAAVRVSWRCSASSSSRWRSCDSARYLAPAGRRAPRPRGHAAPVPSAAMPATGERASTGAGGREHAGTAPRRAQPGPGQRAGFGATSCLRYGDTRALDDVSLTGSVRPGHRRRRRRRRGQDVAAALPGRRAARRTPARCAARARGGSATCRPAPASIRISPWPRTSPSARPPTGCRGAAAAERAAELIERAGLSAAPRPAGRAAVRRDAAEARRDRCPPAPPGAADTRRAEHGRRSGEPVRACGRSSPARRPTARRWCSRRPTSTTRSARARCSCSTPAVSSPPGRRSRSWRRCRARWSWPADAPGRTPLACGHGGGARPGACWCPPAPRCPGERIPPDLQDAVTVAALARELPRPGPPPSPPQPAEPGAREPAGRSGPADASSDPARPLAESAVVTCVFGAASPPSARSASRSRRARSSACSARTAQARQR